jgi:hypothetical protein
MPEIGIGLREFEGYIEFFVVTARDQLDGRLFLLSRPDVSQDDGLTLFHDRFQFHKRAMRVDHDRLGFFREAGFVR